MKWPTTEVLGEGSFETATPSRDKAGKKLFSIDAKLIQNPVVKFIIRIILKT